MVVSIGKGACPADPGVNQHVRLRVDLVVACAQALDFLDMGNPGPTAKQWG